MYQDCYSHYDAQSGMLVVGNSSIEKRMELRGGSIRTVSIRDQRSGACWEGSTSLWQRCPVFAEDEHPDVNVENSAAENVMGMKPHLNVMLTLSGQHGTVWYEWRIFPEIPFVYTQAHVQIMDEIVNHTESATLSRSDGIETTPWKIPQDFCGGADTLDCIPLHRHHMEVESFLLYDKTDDHDALVQRQTTPIYSRGYMECEGNLFRVTDIPTGESLLLVRHAPTPSSALHRVGKELRIFGNQYAAMMGTGVDFTAMATERTPMYASAVGVGMKDDVLDELWRYNTAMSVGDPTRKLFAMSNTWGDRSQDTAVCETFILHEIERARELGLNVIQVDDGWQTGVTANSRRQAGGVWEGYYAYCPGFWEVNKERFPRDLYPVVEKAKEYGMDVGLWFSPDSSQEFANYQKDIDNLCRLHEQYGVCYFKMDGVKIRSKRCEQRFIAILEAVTQRSGGKVRFNLDVTAEDRFGYFYQPQYGTLFVENRYTDWGNYFPHNTFRNLWNLSAVIPARRLQMELLNKHRNPQNYDGIPFAPDRYSPDYLLGTVMPANPLYWMELSNLPQEDVDLLKPLMKLYRRYQEELFASQVIPIGDAPNGMSFSGYLCRALDRNSGHLLLFREETASQRYTYALPFQGKSFDFVILYQSASATVEAIPDGVCVSFEKQRSFVWLTFTRRLTLEEDVLGQC